MMRRAPMGIEQTAMKIGLSGLGRNDAENGH